LVQIQYRPFSRKQHRFEPNDLLEVVSLILSSNPDLSRQLRLKQLDNDALFDAYFDELKLRQLSSTYIKSVRDLLLKLKNHLQEMRPTPELAKTNLSQYVNHKPSTFLTYHTHVQGFMNWYGMKLEFKVKAPKHTPPYYTEEQVRTLLEASQQKKTHKKLSERDGLLIEFAATTGMRRSELASLKVGDLDLVNQRVQVTGKGNKRRTIPLLDSTAESLRKYCRGKHPTESLFGLKAACISNKMSQIAKKAGVDLHTHSLRHYFGTRLLEKGANIRAVQELMGHSSLSTTQVYVGVTAKHLEDAVGLLETKPGSPKGIIQHHEPSDF